MNLMNSRQLKQQAAQRLSNASYNPRRLALIHAVVILICSLVLTVVDYLLSVQISGTGGLEGIRTRSILQTAQSVLYLALAVGTPFWDFGFVAASMGYARQEEVSPRDLTRGFRWFGPIVRFLLLQVILYILIALLATQVGSILIAFTPLGDKTLVLLDAVYQDPQFQQTGVLPDAMLLPLLESMIPVYVVSGVIFAVVAIPMSYRLRLTRYMIIDGPRPRVLMAMLISRQIMKGKCWDYFKLDLSFWWYWLLQVACSVLAYGGVLLAAAGIVLPFDPVVSEFLFYGLNLGASLLLAWRWRAPVETTYALTYDILTGKIKAEN